MLCREEKCGVKGQVAFQLLITVAALPGPSYTVGDVETQGCFVMGTHVSHKGHSVTTPPVSWTFQTHCHVTGKSKHSLPCTARVTPFPQGKELLRDCQTDQTGLRVIATTVTAEESTQEAA